MLHYVREHAKGGSTTFLQCIRLVIGPELPFGRASEFAAGAFPLPIALPAASPRDGERVRVRRLRRRRGSHLLGAAKKSPSTSKIKEAYDAQRADYLKLWAGPRYSHLSRKLWLQVPTVLVAAPHPALSPSRGEAAARAMGRGSDVAPSVAFTHTTALGSSRRSRD